MAAKLDVVIGVVDRASGTLNKISGAGGKMGALVKKGALAGGLALGALGVASLKMGLDFEKSMAEVKTLMPDISEKAFGKMKSDVLDLSKEMGIATNEAVPALYQAISAGVPKENVAEFMAIASKAAIGGVTDLETAVDGITSVTNAYGLENINAQQAADVMFNAVKAGKTDFQQLSSALFNVIPTAASLGISFEDVTAQLAALTASGTPTSVATTQIRAAMVEASKSGTKLDTAIKGLAGKTFPELIKEGKSMPEVFNDLRASMPEQDFKDLFGSVEAVNAVLGVTGPNFEKTMGIMDDAKNSTGAVDAAFDTMSQTASFKLNKAINIVKVTMTELGAKAIPVIMKAVEDVLPVLKEWWSRHGPAIVSSIREIGGYLVAFFAPALDTLADLFDNLKGPMQAVGEFLMEHKELLIVAAAAILLLVAPWLAVVAAIAVVLAKWDEISAFFTDLGADIKTFVDNVIKKVEEFPIIGEIFKDTIRVAKVFIDAHLKAIKLIFDTALKSITNLFKFWKAVFSGDWDEAWNALKDQFKVIVDLLAGLFGIALDAVEAILTSKLEMVKGIGSDLGQLIVDAAKKVWEDLKRKFAAGVNAVATWLEGAASAVTAIGTSLGNLILAGAGAVWDTITTVFSTAVGAIGTWVEGAYETVKGWGSSLANAILDGITGGLNGIISVFEDFLNRVIGAWNSLEFSMSDPTGILDAIGLPSSFTIGTPDIPLVDLPRLHRGGEVLRGGLAIVKTGETWTEPQATGAPRQEPIDYDRLAGALVRALAGVRVEMDGREIGRLQGGRASLLSRGG